MAPNDNLAAVLHGIEDLRLEQFPLPKFGDDEVLLAMDCVGICGSDVHFWVHGRLGPFVLSDPMVIGHESSGIVFKVGKNVTNLKEGDRVAIEPGVPCRHCDYCKEGRYNLCPDVVFCATPPSHGSLRRYFATAADFCYKLPDHVSMEEGALLEPLAVAVHACKRTNVKLGDEVLILGAGPIGLVSILASKAFGASKVVIVDYNEGRLKFAKTLGADFTLKLETGIDEDTIVKKIREFLPRGPNISIDCCGAEVSNRLMILATRSGGVAILVGNGPLSVNVPLINGSNREIDILGSFRYCNDYPTALELVASGKVNVKPLVTHHFDITDTLDAFKTSRHALGGAIKVMIHAQPRDKNNFKPFA